MNPQPRLVSDNPAPVRKTNTWDGLILLAVVTVAAWWITFVVFIVGVSICVGIETVVLWMSTDTQFPDLGHFFSGLLEAGVPCLLLAIPVSLALLGVYAWQRR